jgi:hypothetical protein
MTPSADKSHPVPAFLLRVTAANGWRLLLPPSDAGKLGKGLLGAGAGDIRSEVESWYAGGSLHLLMFPSTRLDVTKIASLHSQGLTTRTIAAYAPDAHDAPHIGKSKIRPFTTRSLLDCLP